MPKSLWGEYNWRCRHIGGGGTFGETTVYPNKFKFGSQGVPTVVNTNTKYKYCGKGYYIVKSDTLRRNNSSPMVIPSKNNKHYMCRKGKRLIFYYTKTLKEFRRLSKLEKNKKVIYTYKPLKLK